ncbi:hypothetical protein GCM10023331_06310 [Algivirga pacifica]|uniref:Lipoprotein n=1 Tax=Algivirga pacifica TaxID=1162670 RepID=A0ABP9D7Q3_9BACT
MRYIFLSIFISTFLQGCTSDIKKREEPLFKTGIVKKISHINGGCYLIRYDSLGVKCSLPVCYATESYYFEKNINIGDSIVKRPYENYIEIYREGRKVKNLSFTYPL